MKEKEASELEIHNLTYLEDIISQCHIYIYIFFYYFFFCVCVYGLLSI